MRLLMVATCNVNQWSMDFAGNLQRIKDTIVEAKQLGCRYRIGSELEISGYGCEDHFLEPDTFEHSWEALAELLDSDRTDGILCDIGMAVMHKSVRYNCRVLIFDRQILLIRPKTCLANDGNYREMRYFASWTRGYTTEPHELPSVVRDRTHQQTAPFGLSVIQFLDASFASEMCEELFTPDSPHIGLGLDGVEVIGNGSGSHHALRKLGTRVDLIRSASTKSGGVYLYANQRGCDGGRLYFDGCAMIFCNGAMLAQGSQFSVREYDMVVATVDLDAVVEHRFESASRCFQAAAARPLPRIFVSQSITDPFSPALVPSQPISVRYLLPEEEIARGPACWLWDYLRRSGMQGYFLPLSGGADSSSTAAIVGSMCQIVTAECLAGTLSVLADVRRIVGDPEYTPRDAADLANKIFVTTFWGTVYSSRETRLRAKVLSEEIGAYHLSTSIDVIVSSIVDFFSGFTGKKPQFEAYGGSMAEDLALQNVQARTRMTMSYMFAQLIPWTRGAAGALLVLGSTNVDEGLRGYMTKYDCSSADINPIGSISKQDIRSFLIWAGKHLGYPSLLAVEAAAPSAELRPITDHVPAQLDEVEMKMTYEELSMFGRLRKLARCGPLTMFRKLVYLWPRLSPQQVADKVKTFFRYYSMNRHKMTTLTPAYHAESYSPEDNRFDLRQFLYNIRWPWQFRRIDEEAGRFVSTSGESRFPLDADRTPC